MSLSYCYFLNNLLRDCLLCGVHGEKHQCYLLKDLATASAWLHAKEIHFPATPSEVNILFIVTEKITVTHMIAEILGTPVCHEPSDEISPLHFCQTVEGSINILKKDS